MEAVRNKHRLQADADKYARMRDELETKAQNAEEAGNDDLAAQFRKEKTFHERTIAEMETPLAEAVSMANTVLRALLDAETKLRELAEEANVTLPDFDAALDSEIKEIDAPVFDAKAEAVINDAIREMKDNQVKNRETAVQAITSKNNLQAEVDKGDYLDREFDRKIQEAAEKGDEQTVNQLVKDKMQNAKISRQKCGLNWKGRLLQRKKIKEAMREDEERVRRRMIEALAMKTRLRHTEIQKRTHAALDSFQLLELDIARETEKLKNRIADRQANEAASKEMRHSSSQ